MSAPLPPGVTIAKPPPELKLKSDDEDGYPYGYHNRFHGHRNEDATLTGTTWPVRIVAGSPEALLAKQFACSGSPDSARYLEATKFRDMPSMTWDEARAAFNRLLVASPRDHVTLAEFALTAAAFGPFTAKKGDHAPKLRKEMDTAD